MTQWQNKKQPQDIREDLVAGRNGVQELLASTHPIECIYLQQGNHGSLSAIYSKTKQQHILIKEVVKAKLDALVPGVAHQGVVAQLAAMRYSTVEDIFTHANGKAPLIIVTDGIEDPHNLGAIIRTAEAAGANGVIIPQRRNVGLTATVAKASAGALEHLPVVKVPNLTQTITALKKQGIWFYAADMFGTGWNMQDFSTGGIGLVIGAEGKGVSRLVKETCDFTVSLPMCGKVSSLNASVAAGVLMYEIVRQRMEP